MWNRTFEKPESQRRNPEDQEGFETTPAGIHDQTIAEKKHELRCTINKSRNKTS